MARPRACGSNSLSRWHERRRKGGLSFKSTRVIGTLMPAFSLRARIFLGATNRLAVETESARLNVVLPAARPAPAEGSIVALSWAPGDLHLMDEPV